MSFKSAPPKFNLTIWNITLGTFFRDHSLEWLTLSHNLMSKPLDSPLSTRSLSLCLPPPQYTLSLSNVWFKQVVFFSVYRRIRQRFQIYWFLQPPLAIHSSASSNIKHLDLGDGGNSLDHARKYLVVSSPISSCWVSSEKITKYLEAHLVCARFSGRFGRYSFQFKYYLYTDNIAKVYFWSSMIKRPNWVHHTHQLGEK